VYAQKSAFDNVVAGVVEEAKRIRLGPGLESGTDMGPLTSDEQFEKVLGYP
jgi:phenylacetaldehyde dehydrogenase